jgi:ADP-heptose:LPS heptosyltransferase
MKIDVERKIDRIAGQAICAALSAVSRMRRPGPEERQPKRILVIMLSEMGSLVLAQPMLAHLRTACPGAAIYALLFERNRECLELFEEIPPERIFTVNGDSFPDLVRDSLRALIQIRKQEIDAVIDCELFSRISSIFSFLSGAAVRVGFHPFTQEGLYRGGFINRPVLYNPYQHISTQFLTLAHALTQGSAGSPCGKRDTGEDHPVVPRLHVGQEAVEALRARLAGDFPGIGGKEMVLLYPGGGLLPIRAWPAENFCTVAEDLLKNGYGVGIIGLREDHDLARWIACRLNSEACFDLTGYTRTVKELITLFHLASLLITNDGGPGHFASLTPLSAIVLFGPETPMLYGPLGKNAVSLHAPLSCSPCLTAYNHRNSPCDGDNRCLKTILPKTVLIEAYRLLKG